MPLNCFVGGGLLILCILKKGARVWGSGSQMVSRRSFFFFAYGSELGMREAMTTGLRERQRASMDVERVVEAQSGLREWSVRENDR